MRKVFRRILTGAVSIAFCFIAAGCGTPVSLSDPFTVRVAVLNGGFGLNWIYTIAEKFNAENSDSAYTIQIEPTTSENATSLSAEVSSGINKVNAFFWSHASIKPLIDANQLVDMSDVYAYKFEGEDKTIAEKCKVSNLLAGAFGGKNGEGLYAVPFADSIAGFVFDHDLFESKGWLVTNGDSLSVGPDGDAGTYDDGQPANITEWNTMLDKIRAESDSYPFVYTTKYPLYSDSIVYGIMAQYMGLEDFNAFYSYNSSFTDLSGNSVSVTPATGYDIYKHPGIKKAISFLNDYLVSDSSNIHPMSYMTGATTHKEAQSYFINGAYKKTSATPIGAMIVEGSWWENEARATFNALEGRGEKAFAFGKRDYRYMLYPAMDGQKGIDGNGNGSVVISMDNGASFVVKSGNTESDTVAKEFLRYTLKEENLQIFTVNSGGLRPFEYSLTDTQYESLTPFRQNVWDIYHDSENVAVVRPYLQRAASPLSKSAALPSFLQTRVGDIPYDYPVIGLRYVTADQYFSGLYTQWQRTWDTYYTPVKELF